MLEGTSLSEGRGTTRPLESFGAPNLPVDILIGHMHRLGSDWMNGGVLRKFWFEPTFQKHAEKLCSGVQIHVDESSNYDHSAFRPWRLMSLVLKVIKSIDRDYPLWRDFNYEYESDRLAIDLINGSSALREWVEDRNSSVQDLEVLTQADERLWLEERNPYLVYA